MGNGKVYTQAEVNDIIALTDKEASEAIKRAERECFAAGYRQATEDAQNCYEQGKLDFAQAKSRPAQYERKEHQRFYFQGWKRASNEKEIREYREEDGRRAEAEARNAQEAKAKEPHHKVWLPEVRGPQTALQDGYYDTDHPGGVGVVYNESGSGLLCGCPACIDTGGTVRL